MRVAVDIIGWTGSVAVVLAYALVSGNRLKATSSSYQVLNLLGSVFLIVNTVFHAAYPSAFVNVVWSGIACASIIAISRKSRG